MTAVAHEIPTPSNPHVHRLGRVERGFRKMADELGIEPGELLKRLLREGVTQSQLAERLNCTRQAVGVLAGRYGLEFPGARINLNKAAQRLGHPSFEHYVKDRWGTDTQKDIAAALGVSLSTVKRRIKDLGL